MKKTFKNSVKLMLILLLAGHLEAHSQQLRLEISLSKQVYLKGESIWLDATLTNISQDSVRSLCGLCIPCQCQFSVQVTDKKGENLNYTGPRWDFVPGSGFLINPGESFYECLDLTEYFGELKSLEDHFFKQLKPGKYSVKSRYAMKGKSIYSNEIVFEIKSPSGSEEEAYNLLKKAWTLFFQKKRIEMRENLREIVIQYPNSAYAEKAYKELFLTVELIEKCPNSGYTENALVRLTDTLSLEQKHKSLHEVINKHPSTRSAKFAEKMLKKIEDQKQ
jgi:hypothetical protein